MILLDILKTRYKNFIVKENQKVQNNFYLLANNTSISNFDFLESTNFYDPDSICVLFNNAYPLTLNSNIRNHQNKWIFFRSLSKIVNNTYYRDLSLLDSCDFTRFYFVPELLDSEKYKNVDYFQNTIQYLKKHNINLSKLHHMDIFESDELRSVRKYYTSIKKTLSSGLWIYLYLKYSFPLSKITLVGYNLNVNTNFHDSSFEYGYILSEILNKKCEHINCLGLD